MAKDFTVALVTKTWAAYRVGSNHSLLGILDTPSLLRSYLSSVRHQLDTNQNKNIWNQDVMDWVGTA